MPAQASTSSKPANAIVRRALRVPAVEPEIPTSAPVVIRNKKRPLDAARKLQDMPLRRTLSRPLARANAVRKQGFALANQIVEDTIDEARAWEPSDNKAQRQAAVHARRMQRLDADVDADGHSKLDKAIFGSSLYADPRTLIELPPRQVAIANKGLSDLLREDSAMSLNAAAVVRPNLFASFGLQGNDAPMFHSRHISADSLTSNPSANAPSPSLSTRSAAGTWTTVSPDGSRSSTPMSPTAFSYTSSNRSSGETIRPQTRDAWTGVAPRLSHDFVPTIGADRTSIPLSFVAGAPERLDTVPVGGSAPNDLALFSGSDLMRSSTLSLGSGRDFTAGYAIHRTPSLPGSASIASQAPSSATKAPVLALFGRLFARMLSGLTRSVVAPRARQADQRAAGVTLARLASTSFKSVGPLENWQLPEMRF
jgi:hypothetical protein